MVAIFRFEVLHNYFEQLIRLKQKLINFLIMNTIYNRLNLSEDHIVSSKSQHPHTPSHCSQSIQSYQSQIIKKSGKRELLRQLNALIRGQMYEMDQQFVSAQNNFSDCKNISPKLYHAKKTDALINQKRKVANYQLKQTMSTHIQTQMGMLDHKKQLGQLQISSTYDQVILEQKKIKHSMLNIYQLLEQYTGAEFKTNFALQEFIQNQQTLIIKASHKKYKEITERNKHKQPINQQYRTNKNKKTQKSYIAYSDQFPSQRIIEEQQNQIKNVQSNNNRQRYYQTNFDKQHQQIYSQLSKSYQSPFYKPKLTKFSPGYDDIYQAIQQRIVTSPCTVSKIPMSRGADRDNQLKYRVEKESKERGNLIRQVKQHEGII